jgi:hypothetical protein
MTIDERSHPHYRQRREADQHHRSAQPQPPAALQLPHQRRGGAARRHRQVCVSRASGARLPPPGSFSSAPSTPAVTALASGLLQTALQTRTSTCARAANPSTSVTVPTTTAAWTRFPAGSGDDTSLRRRLLNAQNRRNFSSLAVSPHNFHDEGEGRVLLADGRGPALAPRRPTDLLRYFAWPAEDVLRRRVARGPDVHGVLQSQSTTTPCLLLRCAQVKEETTPRPRAVIRSKKDKMLSG